MNLNTLGWILSNNDRDETVIQRDDEMGRFKDDEEATKFVAESYMKLLKACEMALRCSDFCYIDGSITWKGKERLKYNKKHFTVKLYQAINKAKGK